jgi:integrase
MPKKFRLPSYRLHKGSGQAVVVLNGKSIYLGVWDSPASHAEYERVIAESLANHRSLPHTEGTAASLGAPPAAALTVSSLILAFWRHAESYYKPDGDTTSELRCIREALRPVRELYGHTEASHFGPLALKAVRQKMIEKGWCRTHINHQVNRIRRMFRWAVSEELLASSVFEALRCVAGLPKGRGGVRESEPVEPAFWEHVAAIKPYCPRPVAAMLELQWLTGMRSGEVRIMRTMDIERTNPEYWLYRPGSDEGEHGQHKNAWRGHSRVIALGPQAVALLTPWLQPEEPAAILFQPREAVEDRNAQRRAQRQTPRTPSQLARKRKKNPQRAPGLCYRATSYAHAVARACKKAGVQFRPYGLRHGRKMAIERAEGADAARAGDVGVPRLLQFLAQPLGGRLGAGQGGQLPPRLGQQLLQQLPLRVAALEVRPVHLLSDHRFGPALGRL